MRHSSKNTPKLSVLGFCCFPYLTVLWAQFSPSEMIVILFIVGIEGHIQVGFIRGISTQIASYSKFVKLSFEFRKNWNIYYKELGNIYIRLRSSIVLEVAPLSPTLSALK